MTLHKKNAARFANQASILVLAAMAISATGAQAQTATAKADTAGQVQELVVTATRRTEKLQDVPVSASVLTSGTLKAMSTAGQDIRMLAFKVPSLNIESSNGRTFPRFYIRGYGNTDFNSFASQPVSLVYDDIVQENAALKGFPAFDLSDVEVLRGPQGTLFGRNTPAGVVKFESAKPNFDGVHGYYNVSDATYNTANVEAAINVPLDDKVAVRASLQEQHRDNWVSDPINNTKLEGYDDLAGRLQLLYKPTDDFSALFNIHGRSLNGSARLFRANIFKPNSNELVSGFDPSKIYTDGANAQNFSSIGGNLHLTWQVGDIKLFSITGYESILHYFTRGDVDGGNLLNIGYPGKVFFPVATAGGISDHKQVTQEFRAESEYSGPLNWQAGGYFFYENTFAPNYDYDTSGAKTDRTVFRQENTAGAVFGSVDYKLTSKLKLTGGVRYTEDSKQFQIVSTQGPISYSGPTSRKASASRFNWDISGLYQVDPDLSLYARVATGFRAPSFGAPSHFSRLPIQVAKSEDVTSYEGGVKAYLFDRRARLDFDIYHFDVKNQQLTAVGGSANQTALINAKKTEGDGVELDFEAKPIDHLVLTMGGSYNFTAIHDKSLAVGVCAQCTVIDPTFTDAKGSKLAIIDGNPLPQAPKWVGNWTLRYSVPVGDGEAYFYTDWSYRSKINFFLYESAQFDGPSLLEGGLRAGYTWHNGKYDAAVFCRNCTDQIVAVGGIDFDDNTGFINDPRIVGVQFSGKF